MRSTSIFPKGYIQMPMKPILNPPNVREYIVQLIDNFQEVNY